MTVSIMLNGEKKELDSAVTVSELIRSLGIRTGAMAVEINQKIVPKTDYDNVTITDGDRVEIVTFVGGG